jgi:Ferritin-like domain
MGSLIQAARGEPAPDSHSKNKGAIHLSKKDIDTLNFALNLEYLEAQYYSFATTGAGIDAQGAELTGLGMQGDVTIKANPQVPFATAEIQQVAQEIAADELAHVNFLRSVLGDSAVAQPAIDLQNSFTAAAVAGCDCGWADV